MATQLQKFDFTEFTYSTIKIRVDVDSNNDVWFCAKDICDALEYICSQLKRKVPEIALTENQTRIF